MKIKIKIFLVLLLVYLNCFSQKVARQPFYFQTKSLIETLNYIGNPINEVDQKAIKNLIENLSDPSEIEKIIDTYALFEIVINPESRVKVNPGKATPELFQNGWKTFLIKVENQAGITAELKVISEQAKRIYDGGERIYGLAGAGKGEKVSDFDIENRWMDIEIYTKSPMKVNLTGLSIDYFIIQIYSRDSGKRAAKFEFNCGQATQDIGFGNETSFIFNCIPSQKIMLEINDFDQKPTMASLTIKDKQGHIYPSQMKRLAPDFFFQSQIYRKDGESLELPIGDYFLNYSRGPEYISKTKSFTVTNASNQSFQLNLERWINPSQFYYYSGDHHIHASGCSHYTAPTQGVNPEDMFRHTSGEGLNVGCVLTWGPGYDHQKQFFEGKDNALSTKENLLRYDLEISGFPSSHAGHLVLLRLKDQNYPNTNKITDWPTYTIPVLKWAKAQNAITGYAHSGLGLEVQNDALPNYEMPKFDGIGANEYIVAVTQNLVDFISTMDTPPTWELNIWYHTLNCGFRTRISGETDFPCMSDDVVGHGRSYVKLKDKLNFDEWTAGLKLGKDYVSEGKSHIMDFKVNDVEVGTKNSEVNLSKPSNVKISAKVAAFLNETIDPKIQQLNILENVWTQKPFWNLERARIEKTRTVAVELIVNGEAIASKIITANGSLQDIIFNATIEKSSWVALRIMSSSHSNPIFVLIDKKPIRANKKSAEWCLKAVDVCWNSKNGQMSTSDKELAQKDYEEAKKTYQNIIKETK